MGNSLMSNSISHYNQVDRFSGVTEANPHRLVLMLLEGAISKIAIVKGLMIRKEVAKKGELIGQSIAIVGGLKSSLDKEAGGEIATNLGNLYEYIEHRLLTANLKNDVTILDEVSKLLHEVKAGWESIPAELRTSTSTNISVAS
jgi:flagellar protein FliS